MQRFDPTPIPECTDRFASQLQSRRNRCDTAWRVEHDPGLIVRQALAGDAEMIAPVSSEIPCKQGIFQGISEISSPRRRREARGATTSCGIPYEVSGTTFSSAGIPAGRSGKTDGAEMAAISLWGPTVKPHVTVFDKSARTDGTFSRHDFTMTTQVPQAGVADLDLGQSSQVQSDQHLDLPSAIRQGLSQGRGPFRSAQRPRKSAWGLLQRGGQLRDLSERGVAFVPPPAKWMDPRPNRPIVLHSADVFVDYNALCYVTDFSAGLGLYIVEYKG
jgi:hypothetical protein